MTQDHDLPLDTNRGPQILIVTGTFTLLALITVILRTWVRVRIVKFMGPEDWTMLAAMLVMVIEMAIIIPQVSLGAGRHWQYIHPPSNIARGLHLNFVTQPLCLIALCLAKASVGLFLVRIATTRRGFRWFLQGWIVFTILSSLGNILTVFFQCRPLALTWDHGLEGSCLPPSNLRTAALVNSSISALTDVVFALVPIPMLWRVQLDLKDKVVILGALSLGLLACAAAVVKITFLNSYGHHGDFLYDSSDLTIWTTIEICTAIIAASIPCFKPLTKLNMHISVPDRYIRRFKRRSQGQNQQELSSRQFPEGLEGRNKDELTAENVQGSSNSLPARRQEGDSERTWVHENESISSDDKARQRATGAIYESE